MALARGELAQRQDAFDTDVSEQRYLERCRLKTATLFECACLLGRDDEALAEFGAAIGLAFQLLDDVLDVSGPPERTGKARGTDLLDGTVTLPLIARRGAPIRSSASATCARLDPAAAERSAIGSPPPARSTGSARGRWRWSPRRRRGLGARRPRCASSAGCSTSSPTASSSATAERPDSAKVVGGRSGPRRARR